MDGEEVMSQWLNRHTCPVVLQQVTEDIRRAVAAADLEILQASDADTLDAIAQQADELALAVSMLVGIAAAKADYLRGIGL